MAVAAFSGDGKYYSAITRDGRLRIWDTETNVLKQEYTPDLHLTSPPSCLQWITVTQSLGSPKKGGKRTSSISEQEMQCIVLGTASGKILIYSVAQGNVQTVLEEENNEVHNKYITALDWHRKHGLYSCNKENLLYEWDMQSASIRNKYNINVDDKNKQVNSVSAIKLIPHKQKTPAVFLVTASWQVKIWRLHNGEATVIRNLGHNAAPTAVLTLATMNDVCWLIEGSQNERLLSFYDATISDDNIPQVNGDDPTPTKRQRKKSLTKHVPPTYNFVLEDAPRLIDVNVTAEDGGTRLSIAAATRSGVVHYYGHMLNGSSTKPIKPSVTIQVTTADAQPLPLVCCRLPPTGDLLLGYKSGLALAFERVMPELNTKTQVLIRGETQKDTKKKVDQTSEINKVLSDQNNTDVTYVEPMGGVSRKRAKPGGKVEVPMEARLSNLALDASRSQAAVSENLTKLLMQGLHSKDNSIILTVLRKNNPAVAIATVASLPADYIPQLLEQICDMASKKTQLCAAACTWLAAVLRLHSALLLATVSANPGDHLTQLLATFTHRRSHLCQLLNLRGRLQLTSTQRATENTYENQEPVLNYHDTSSDSEMEVEQEESDDAQSWDDKPDTEADEDSDVDSG